MADITMCSNKLCPLAGSCYRVQATPNDYWQSMASFQYEHQDNGVKCEAYWPMHELSVSDKAEVSK